MCKFFYVVGMVTGKKCGNYFEQDQNDLNKHQLDSKQSKKIEYSFLHIKKYYEQMMLN